MNQELPKPLRNALSRQAVGEAHPSPDVLTAFMERTLAPLENEVVTHHLAQCAECRDVVFLASAAAEEAGLDERELVAAAAGRRMAAQPTMQASAAQPAMPALAPRSKWTIRLRWLVPVAALAALVAGALMVQWPRFGSRQETAMVSGGGDRATSNPEPRQSVATLSTPEASAKTPAPAVVAKAQPHPPATARVPKAQPSAVVAHNAAEQTQPTVAQAPPPASNPPALGGDLGTALAGAVPTQNSFAESNTARAISAPGAATGFAKPMGLYLSKATNRLWRISPEGRVEHATAPDEWTSVLTDQPSTFHAVAAIGSDVWAGGDGGALFHSADDGQHWNKVAFAAGSKVETGAIVSIRFVDPQHGTVASDSGTRWVTTDGGVSWTKP